jgi:hypothetical protein
VKQCLAAVIPDIAQTVDLDERSLKQQAFESSLAINRLEPANDLYTRLPLPGAEKRPPHDRPDHRRRAPVRVGTLEYLPWRQQLHADEPPTAWSEARRSETSA